MRRVILGMSALSLLLVSTLTYARSGDCPANGSLSYLVPLFGSQFGGQGSPYSFGTAFITLHPENGTLTTSIRTSGLVNVTSAALNAAGASSPALVIAGDQIDGTVPVAPELMDAIVTNPSKYTLSLATPDYPAGAVSGSLTPAMNLGGTLSGAAVVGASRALAGGGSFLAAIAPSPEGGDVLNFTFTPTGIGDAVTALELRQGREGTNGALVASLASASTLTVGTLAGSVALPNEMAARVITNPDGYYVLAKTAGYPEGAVRAQLGTKLDEVFIPVTGSGRGAAGNRWETEVRIFNASWAPATVTVERLASGRPNSTTGGSLSPVQIAVMMIAPRSLATIDTANEDIAGLRNSFGAIALLADQPIVANARIYDDRRSEGHGTYGATIPGVTLCDAITRGVIGGISNAQNGGASNLPVRTNLGFLNPNPVPVALNLHAESSAAAPLASRSLTLGPYEQLQSAATGANGLFNLDSDLNSGVVTFEASGPVVAYASVVDNASGDSLITYAAEDRVAQPMSDNDIADVAVAATQGQIREGVEAASGASSTTVKTYAQDMTARYTETLQALLIILGETPVRPNPNPMSMGLRQESQTAQTALSALSGTAFDRAYMQRQVEEHRTVLTLLDQVLIPSAQRMELHEFLVQMRSLVAPDFERAQEILKGL